MKVSRSINFTWMIILIIGCIFVWDIDNLSAVRQGTEALYLQISKEMFNQSSFLTPIYKNGHHWSKPPLHFWLAMPLYKISGSTALIYPRMAMVLVSLVGLFMISRWSERNQHIPINTVLLFFASSLAFVKYSRIFMMEMPLMVFTVVASLKFYDHYKTNKLFDLALAILFLTAATLIKGPVALVMCLGACGIFVIIKHITDEKSSIKPYIIFTSISILLSSLWFIISYINHGEEFFNTFFLKQNLGKFYTRRYSVRSVIQGLFFYSFPWSILFPVTVIYFFKKIKNVKNLLIIKEYEMYLFLLINFFIFFLLWFFPTQRSHHYALPSIPFFLLIILQVVYSTESPNSADKVLTFSIKIFNTVFAFMAFILGFFVLYITALIPDFLLDTKAIVYTGIAVVLIFANSSMYFWNYAKFYKALGAFLTMAFLWIFYISIFYLPTVPTDVVSLIGKNQVASVRGRTYFLSEALGQNVQSISPMEIGNYLTKNPNNFVLIRENAYKQHNFRGVSSVLQRWPVWKRRTKSRDFKKILSTNNLKPVQEYMLLLKKR
ncbi:MAG: glycosyltransferase family 39 protein [Bacteriovoracaceae bacterium]|nr:glycosyltransferase family 39 protein [Bacteriovoracaceae bacterium]